LVPYSLSPKKLIEESLTNVLLGFGISLGEGGVFAGPEACFEEALGEFLLHVGLEAAPGDEESLRGVELAHRALEHCPC